MLRPLPIETTEDVLLVPRATLAKPIGFFAKKLEYELLEGCDDLDYFRALIFILNDDLIFMLSRHNSQSRNETVVSLPINIGSSAGIDAALGRILDELAIPFRKVIWQEKGNDSRRSA